MKCEKVECQYDYIGGFDHWQKQLDEAGVDYRVDKLMGMTYSEIDEIVRVIIKAKKDKLLPAKKEEFVTDDGLPF